MLWVMSGALLRLATVCQKQVEAAELSSRYKFSNSEQMQSKDKKKARNGLPTSGLQPLYGKGSVSDFDLAAGHPGLPPCNNRTNVVPLRFRHTQGPMGQPWPASQKAQTRRHVRNIKQSIKKDLQCNTSSLAKQDKPQKHFPKRSRKTGTQ